MTTPPIPPEAEKARDKMAIQQGDNHANPIIRSMYPSKSRGEMAREFAQLFAVGWNACWKYRDAEVAKLKSDFTILRAIAKASINTFDESDITKLHAAEALIETLAGAVKRTQEYAESGCIEAYGGGRNPLDAFVDDALAAHEAWKDGRK